MAATLNPPARSLGARLKPTPLIFQQERSECALACLAMVASAIKGSEISLGELRTRCRVGQGGLSAAHVLELGRSLGMHGRGVRLEPDALAELRLPAILHWDMDHFVVLVRVRRRHCVLHDPAAGKLRLAQPELSKHFTGVAVEFWSGDQVENEPGPASDSGRWQQLRLVDLWTDLRGSTGHMVWVLLLSVLTQLLAIMVPWHVQWTVDEGLLRGDVDLIAVLAVGFACLLCLRVALQWVRGVVVSHLGHTLAYVFANRFFWHLIRLPLNWFQLRGVGDVAARFNSLVPVRDFYTQGAALLVVDASVVVLSAVAMLVYSTKLAALTIGLEVVFVLLYLSTVPRLKRLSLSTIVAEGREQNHLLESIKAIQSVKTYALETGRLQLWQKLHAATLDHSLTLQLTHNYLRTAALLLSGAGLIVTVTYGAYDIVEAQNLSIGMLMAFLSYRGYFSERLRSLTEQWVQIKTLSVHLMRLGDVLLESPDEVAPGDGSEDVEVRGQARKALPDVLQLANIEFAYSDVEAPVLCDLSLEIEPGEFVAIVGQSGSGKSTLLKIMMGLLFPRRGTLHLGASRMSRENRQTWRHRFGCVVQEDRFLSGSICDNVAGFGDVEPTRLADVLHQVGILATISTLPMGVRTQIGELEAQFSSGQMQRLVLARALYRDPDYLLIDEGTSHLDPQSSAHVQQLVRGLSMTRIVITHDMDFAVLADRVLCLEGGTLRELGKQEIGQLKLQ